MNLLPHARLVCRVPGLPDRRARRRRGRRSGRRPGPGPDRGPRQRSGHRRRTGVRVLAAHRRPALDPGHRRRHGHRSGHRRHRRRIRDRPRSARPHGGTHGCAARHGPGSRPAPRHARALDLGPRRCHRSGRWAGPSPRCKASTSSRSTRTSARRAPSRSRCSRASCSNACSRATATATTTRATLDRDQQAPLNPTVAGSAPVRVHRPQIHRRSVDRTVPGAAPIGGGAANVYGHARR